jgi:hypothetical protein
MKIIKGNIKFSDLPRAEQVSEIEGEALNWKNIFQDEENWKTCTDNEYREHAKKILIVEQDLDCKKYSLIELENGRRKWVLNENLERAEQNEELGIY